MSTLIKIAETHEKMGEIYREIDVADKDGERIEKLAGALMVQVIKLQALKLQLDEEGL